MKIIDTKINDLYIFHPEPIKDNRGFFSEVFTQRELDSIGHTKPILQVNHTRNVDSGTLRGMHFQHPPEAEVKIIKCIKGAIFDVAVDIRKDSPTLLQWHGEILSEENMTMLYIPEGFAHGFQTLEPNTEVIYFTTNYYSPEHIGGIRYNDSKLGIKWPVEITELSERDKTNSLIDDDFMGV